MFLKVKAVARDDTTWQGVFYIKIFTTENWLFTSALIFRVNEAKEWSDSNTQFENTKIVKFKLYKNHKKYNKFKQDSLEIVNYPSHIELLKERVKHSGSFIFLFQNFIR